MKKKDIVYLVIAVAIFAIVGILVYSRFSSKGSSSQGTVVEVIAPISSDFNQTAMSALSDPTKTVNFQPDINLNGLGNSRPFGPLQ